MFFKKCKAKILLEFNRALGPKMEKNSCNSQEKILKLQIK